MMNSLFIIMFFSEPLCFMPYINKCIISQKLIVVRIRNTLWLLILCTKIIYHEKLGDGKPLISSAYTIRKYVVKCVRHMCMHIYTWAGTCVFLISKLIAYNWLCIEITFGRHIPKHIIHVLSLKLYNSICQ